MQPPKGTSLCGNTSYDIHMIKIDPLVRPVRGTKKPNKRQEPEVAKWVFTQTNHILTSRCSLSWWVAFGW